MKRKFQTWIIRKIVNWLVNGSVYDIFSRVLYEDHKKYLGTKHHDAPPPGHVWVKQHLRRK